MDIFDYIVIGAGVAGLYTNYKLNKLNFKTLCLESKPYVGGRAVEKDFGGIKVKMGGGVSDIDSSSLSRLLDKLLIPKKWMRQQADTSKLMNRIDMNKTIEEIKEKYHKIVSEIYPNKLNISVNDFLTNYFGEEYRDLYYQNTQFFDYKNQDINDYVLRYPIDDEYDIESDVYTFSHSELFEKLYVDVVNEHVDNVKKYEDDLFLINNKYYTKNVIVCTTIDCAKKLFKYPSLDQIESVPFFRTYTLHDEKLTPTKGVVLVDSEIDKYTRINENIMMSIYADSENALFWKNELEKGTLEETLKEKFKELPEIKDSISVFWDEGIHYFKPDENNKERGDVMREEWLFNNMSPEKGIFFAGEYFSDKGGWIEGAIRSVEFMFDNFIN